MASIAFPTLAKKVKLSDGTTYGYAVVSAQLPQKPTFLLLHGYPSSSFDWRHQIQTLDAAGYGVIVPDLLGYGDTDKPEDVDSYRLKVMVRHLAEILDHEGVQRCIAVGHDWGCGLLSRLPTYMSERLLGIVPISVGYIEPGMAWDIDAFNQLTESLFGYATYGYWPWHNTEDSIGDCDRNPASVFTLIYAANAKDWKTNLAPIGAAEQYVCNGRVDELPTWYSLSEYTTRDRIIAKGGYRGPINWYKAAMRGINVRDEAEVTEEDKYCKVPTLLIVSDEDYVTRAEIQIQKCKEWVRDLRIEMIEGCGHWIQLERPQQLGELLERFGTEISTAET